MRRFLPFSGRSHGQEFRAGRPSDLLAGWRAVRRSPLALALAAAVAFTSACFWRPRDPAEAGWSAPSAAVGVGENPFFTPIADREFLWSQIVDTIDDYFKIQREQRVRAVGGELIPGRIDTFPTVGATLFEPWRRDSTPGFERLHSTLQTVRRRAQVAVTPTEGGYFVEVAVFKELEDLERPEHATVAASASPHDGSLVPTEPAAVGTAATLGWIPMGRDLSLEQQILREVRGRLADGAPRQRAGIDP